MYPSKQIGKYSVFAATVVTALTLMGCAGQTTVASDGATRVSAPQRYLVSANGVEVTDTQTGLTWRRCSEGQTWNGLNCTGPAEEYNYRDAAAHARRQATSVAAWRVPTLEELNTLALKGERNPSINVGVFPGTPSGRYMTSTAHENEATQVWIVYFNDGHNTKYHKNNKAHVRLVR